MIIRKDTYKYKKKEPKISQYLIRTYMAILMYKCPVSSVEHGEKFYTIKFNMPEEENTSGEWSNMIKLHMIIRSPIVLGNIYD